MSAAAATWDPPLAGSFAELNGHSLPTQHTDDAAAARHRTLQLLGIELRARGYNPAPGRQVFTQEGAKKYGLPIGATITPGMRRLTEAQQQKVADLPEAEQAKYQAARKAGSTHTQSLAAAKGTPAKKAAPRKAAKKATPQAKEKAAVDRQDRIDKVRGKAETLAEVLQIVNDGGSNEALKHRINARVKRGDLDEKTRDRLIEAVDNRTIGKAVDRIAEENGLTITAEAGDVVAWTPETGLLGLSGGGFRRGTFVSVVRPGVQYDPGDGNVAIVQGLAEEATPEEIADFKKAADRKRPPGADLWEPGQNNQGVINEITTVGVSADAERKLLRRYGIPESEWPERLRPTEPANTPLADLPDAQRRNYEAILRNAADGGTTKSLGTSSATKQRNRHIDDLVTEGYLEQDPASREAEVENRIRAVFTKHRTPGGWAPISAIREDLADVPRAEQDSALLRLAVTPGVTVIPWDNFKALSQKDRESAIRIGGQDSHAFRFEDPSPRPVPDESFTLTDKGRQHVGAGTAFSEKAATEKFEAPADPESLRDDLDLKKVPELKQMLRDAGLPVSGKKRELVDRLVEHQAGGVEPPAAQKLNPRMPSRDGMPDPDAGEVAGQIVGLDSAPDIVAALAPYNVRQLRAIAARLRIAVTKLNDGQPWDVDSLAAQIARDVIRTRGRSTIRSRMLQWELRDVPGNNELKHYWTRGEGLKRWRFHPHPWTRLRNLLREHVGPGRAERMASDWFHEVFGYWPGHRKGKNPVGPG